MEICKRLLATVKPRLTSVNLKYTVYKRTFVYFGFDSKIRLVFGKSYLLPFNADKRVHLMPGPTKITNIPPMFCLSFNCCINLL